MFVPNRVHLLIKQIGSRKYGMTGMGIFGTLTLMWVPSHTGVDGNEEADQLNSLTKRFLSYSKKRTEQILGQTRQKLKPLRV
jgi:hypothetical protein